MTPDPAAEKPDTDRTTAGRLLRAGVLALVTALIALLLWATLAAGEGRGLVARIAAGERPAAPAFELEVIWDEASTSPADLRPALEDGKLALNELRGRPVVLNFWASWCIPCREEAPVLNGAARAYRGKVVFVGVNVQDLRGDALAFLREFDVPYVSIRDRADATFRAYGLTGVPETYYLDAQGRIVAHAPGAITRDSLEMGIVQAIEGRSE